MRRQACPRQGLFARMGCMRPAGRNDEFYDVEVDSTGGVVACGSNARGRSAGRTVRHWAVPVERATRPQLRSGTRGIRPTIGLSRAGRACATDSTDRIVAAVRAFGAPSNGIMVVRFSANGRSRCLVLGSSGSQWIAPRRAPPYGEIYQMHC